MLDSDYKYSANYPTFRIGLFVTSITYIEHYNFVFTKHVVGLREKSRTFFHCGFGRFVFFGYIIFFRNAGIASLFSILLLESKQTITKTAIILYKVQTTEILL